MTSSEQILRGSVVPFSVLELKLPTAVSGSVLGRILGMICLSAHLPRTRATKCTPLIVEYRHVIEQRKSGKEPHASKSVSSPYLRGANHVVHPSK